jgi:WD40 repeat protein
VGAIAYSPDGKYVASGDNFPSNSAEPGATNEVKIWNPNSGEIFKTFPTEGWIQSLAYSRDGSQLLVSNQLPPGAQFVVTNWDIASGKQIFKRTIETPFWVNVAFSPDGSRWVASADAPGTHIYDATTGQQLVTLGDVKTPTDSAIFSPDGTLVATTNFADGDAKLWDAATGKELLNLHEEANAMNSDFSPDGTHLAVATATGVRIYLVRVDDLVDLAKTRVTRSLTQEECSRYLHVEQCPP